MATCAIANELPAAVEERLGTCRQHYAVTTINYIDIASTVILGLAFLLQRRDASLSPCDTQTLEERRVLAYLEG